MFKPIKFVEYDNGKLGYSYCRGCLRKPPRKKWGYCFCSFKCMDEWIKKNRLVFYMFEDYKDYVFSKDFNVQQIFSLDLAAEILTPIIANRVRLEVEEQFHRLVSIYSKMDSIESIVHHDRNKTRLFDLIREEGP